MPPIKPTGGKAEIDSALHIGGEGIPHHEGLFLFEAGNMRGRIFKKAGKRLLHPDFFGDKHSAEKGLQPAAFYPVPLCAADAVCGHIEAEMGTEDPAEFKATFYRKPIVAQFIQIFDIEGGAVALYTNQLKQF